MKKSILRHPVLGSPRVTRRLNNRSSQIKENQLDQHLIEAVPQPSLTRRPLNYLQTTTILEVGELLRATTTMPTLSRLRPMLARKRLKPGGCSKNSYRE